MDSCKGTKTTGKRGLANSQITIEVNFAGNHEFVFWFHASRVDVRLKRLKREGCRTQ
jgi:hypothetical protein